MTGARAWRGTVRRVSLGLATVCGIRRKGFFIPYRYADTIADPAPRDVLYPRVKARFDAAAPDFADLLRQMQTHHGALAAIGSDGACRARWDQDWFPRLDAAAAYTMVRCRRPARIVEIGSGHSTRFFARALADAGIAAEITAIDPAPRADIAAMKAVTPVRTVVQDADPALFARLGAGDILSVDSSHILMPGTDVDMVLNGIVGGLAKGVLLHFHDIFLPWGYPPHWAWRAYNEQQGVAVLLTGSAAWRPLWSSAYAVREMAPEGVFPAITGLPLSAGALESSLWLERVEDPVTCTDPPRP